MALNVEFSREKVIDPHKHKECFTAHRDEIQTENMQDRAIILEYLNDMAYGLNVTGKRGKRGYTRLNTIRSRMAVLSRLIGKETGKNLITVNEQDLTILFTKMREGKVLNTLGKPYRSTADYAISFKAFWHWHMKRQRKVGITLPDIAIDLDTSTEKPKFHYLTKDQVSLLANNAKPYYRALIWFLFDSGIRSPTEMMNVKVRDIAFNKDFAELNIRDETSKTFGRKIKLLLCKDIIKQHIAANKLQPQDFLFKTSPGKTNQYLGRLGHRILGIGRLSSDKNISDGITMYDFRHCAACHWLPKYKSESALKYRFGWKNSDMIHYYTEFLGMKDTISQDDLIDSEEKGRLEKEIEEQKQQMARMQEQMQAQNAMLEAFFAGKIGAAKKKYEELQKAGK